MPGRNLPGGLTAAMSPCPYFTASSERELVIFRPPWWILLGAFLMVDVAGAGVVHGIVRIAPSAARDEPRASVREVVVYLDSIPPKLERKLAKHAADGLVFQSRNGFRPNVLAIAAGTDVRFQNRDRVYHNVFSVTPVCHFDVGPIPPRASRLVRFRNPGVVQIFCELDSEESGFLFVTPNHAFTQPDRAGRFRLPKLKSGRYLLRLWHPSLGAASREIEMPRRGDLTLDLSL